MLAVFNLFIDSLDAATRGVLEKTVFKSSCFLKNNFLVGCISNENSSGGSCC